MELLREREQSLINSLHQEALARTMGTCNTTYGYLFTNVHTVVIYAMAV